MYINASTLTISITIMKKMIIQLVKIHDLFSLSSKVASNLYIAIFSDKYSAINKNRYMYDISWLPKYSFQCKQIVITNSRKQKPEKNKKYLLGLLSASSML